MKKLLENFGINSRYLDIDNSILKYAQKKKE